MTGDTAERADHRELTIEQLWEGVSAELRGKQRSKPHFEEVCRRAFILWNEQAFALVYSLLHQPGGRSLISRMLCRKDPLLSRDPMRLDLLAQEVLVGLCRTFKKKRFQYQGLPQLYGYLDGICTRVIYARSGLREKRQKVIKSIKKSLPLDEDELAAVLPLFPEEGTGEEGEDPEEVEFERLILLNSLRGRKLGTITGEPLIRKKFDESSTGYVNQFLYNRQQTVLWHFYVRVSGEARNPDNSDLRRVIERLVPASLRGWRWRDVSIEQTRQI
jgi:hypothetical protein